MGIIREFFTRKNLILFVLSVLLSMALTGAFELVLNSHARDELNAVRIKAGNSIAQFAPWNLAARYFAIVTADSGSPSEFAQSQQNWCEAIRNVPGSSPCDEGPKGFFLSAHVPLPLRPVTAFFDVLWHTLVDQGFVGFLVAAAQLALGFMATLLVIRQMKLKMNSFYSWVLGVPVGVLVLGSVLAIPLWLLAYLGATLLKAVPAVALGGQAGGTGYIATWITGRTMEVAGHEIIMKKIERMLPAWLLGP